MIPCGIYGHTSPVFTVPGRFPYYAVAARGCRYQDPDGNWYLDFLCGYGAVLLGYGYPQVEEAAARQREKGNCMNHPAPIMVELAEKLLEVTRFGSWVVFAKNGSDVTTWAIAVARLTTGRRKVLKVAGAYHGVGAWCNPTGYGFLPEERSHVHDFRWNDLDSFRKLVEEYHGDVAAVVLCPFHHPSYGRSILPDPGFFPTVRKICRREGIVLVLDDIRAGFRLHRGGSHQWLGIEPDILCLGKALGNGYPISVAIGREELRVAASRVFLTGTYWNNAVAMAAALEMLKILEQEPVVEHVQEVGRRFCQGLRELAWRYGFDLQCSGPPSMPFATFSGDDSFFLQQEFCARVAAQGVFLHPHHNWFMSYAHRDLDIAEAFDKIEIALRQLREGLVKR